MRTDTIPATDTTARPATVELAVGGMTCAACVGRVERRLGKLEVELVRGLGSRAGPSQ